MADTWKVEFDGPSRPILTGPNMRMFSISKFYDGRWIPFYEEEKFLQMLADKLNNHQHQIGCDQQQSSQDDRCTLCGVERHRFEKS